MVCASTTRALSLKWPSWFFNHRDPRKPVAGLERADEWWRARQPGRRRWPGRAMAGTDQAASTDLANLSVEQARP
jgi:hypothetical protein